MATELKQISRSRFAEPPVKLKVGCNGKIYYVHPGVLAPFSSSALYARVHGTWKGTGEDMIDLTEFDEQTIEHVLSYFYTQDYCPIQDDWRFNPTIENEARLEDSSSIDREENQEGGGKSYHEPPVDDPVARPLTPIEDIFETKARTKLHDLGAPDHNCAENDQCLPTEVLDYAKVYSFAHKYLISELEEFATCRLAQTLVILQGNNLVAWPHLAEAIELIYRTTPRDSQNPARRLLSQFSALSFTSLLDGHLDTVILEGGDFAVDVSHKVARRIEELVSRFSALETQCSEMKSDLDLSREDVRGWENWNNSLLPKRQRWRNRYPSEDPVVE